MAKETTDATRTADTKEEEQPRLFAFWPGGAASAELPPAGKELAIGRDAGANLCIPHASVSRAHAVIRGGEPPTIRDVGSHNGTVVGGRKLGEGESAELAVNQVVKLGSASLI